PLDLRSGRRRTWGGIPSRRQPRDGAAAAAAPGPGLPRAPAGPRGRGRGAGRPGGEVAVVQGEVEVNTNPKIGSMWMRRGEQAKVVTPGNNVKRYLSGSLNWRTGELVLTEGKPGQGRNTDLFLAHLDELRRGYRRERVIHVS